MKYLIFLTIQLILSYSSFAEFPYEHLDDSYISNPSTAHEVPFMAPTKSQDGIGLCYGFSSTLLLENYRCKQLKLNCLETKNFISPLDVSSYQDQNTRGLREGGFSDRLLTNISHSDRKLVKEECANFSSMIVNITSANGKSKGDEKIGWDFLIDKWKQFKGQLPHQKKNDCISCLVNEIKSKLKNVQTPAEQLESAFKTAQNVDEFLFKSLLPLECLRAENTIEVPPFEVSTFPTKNDNKSDVALAQKIETLLMNDTPLEMSICVNATKPGACAEGEAHSLVLFAIKEVCSEKQKLCRTMVRVKNSYGYKWQKDHNDGWVDLATLIVASRGHYGQENITWLSPPKIELKDKNLKRNGDKSDFQKVDGNVPALYKTFKGIWKCPGDKYKKDYESGCLPFMDAL